MGHAQMINSKLGPLWSKGTTINWFHYLWLKVMAQRPIRHELVAQDQSNENSFNHFVVLLIG